MPVVSSNDCKIEIDWRSIGGYTSALSVREETNHQANSFKRKMILTSCNTKPNLSRVPEWEILSFSGKAVNRISCEIKLRPEASIVVQCIHSFMLRRRSALAITDTELKLIAAAA